MAGKKRSSIVDDNVKLSKTAKRSQNKKKEEGFIASGDIDRIIPLSNGEWAYLLDPNTGKTHHLRVGSPEWVQMMADLVEDPKHGARIQAQLVKLGW